MNGTGSVTLYYSFQIVGISSIVIVSLCIEGVDLNLSIPISSLLRFPTGENSPIRTILVLLPFLYVWFQNKKKSTPRMARAGIEPAFCSNAKPNMPDCSTFGVRAILPLSIFRLQGLCSAGLHSFTCSYSRILVPKNATFGTFVLAADR